MSLLVKLVGSAFITVSAGGGIYAGVVSQSSNNTSLTSSSHTETLQKEPIQESTSLEQTQDTNSHQEEHKTETTEEGNCKVVTDLGEVIEELSLTSSHISITCSSQGITEPEDVSLSPRWTALFPRNFFIESGAQLTEGRGLTIKTDTNVSEEEDGETYRTIFQSDSFSLSNGKRITGRWDYEDDFRGGKKVDPVRVVSPVTQEKIYFVRPNEE